MTIDDLIAQGINHTPAEWIAIGERIAADAAWRSAMYQASCVSVERERADDTPGFHAAEECCRRIRAAKERHEQILKAQEEQRNAEQH